MCVCVWIIIYLFMYKESLVFIRGKSRNETCDFIICVSACISCRGHFLLTCIVVICPITHLLKLFKICYYLKLTASLRSPFLFLEYTSITFEFMKSCKRLLYSVAICDSILLYYKCTLSISTL